MKTQDSITPQPAHVRAFADDKSVCPSIVRDRRQTIARSLKLALGAILVALFTTFNAAAQFGPTDFLVADLNGYRIAVYDQNLVFQRYLDSNSTFRVSGLDFMSNGNLAATGYSQAVKTYTSAGTVVSNFTDSGIINPIDVKRTSADLLLIGSQNSQPIQEFTKTGTLTRSFGNKAYTSLAVLPNNVLWAGTPSNGIIDVFNLTTGTLTSSITLDNGQSYAYSMYYSPATNTVLSCGNNKVYERTTTGAFVRQFSGGGGCGFGVTRGPNGDVFATNGGSGLITRWQANGTLSGTTAISLSFAMNIVWAGNRSFVVNNNGDTGDATPGDDICETATGNGICTLRAAVQESNARAGDDKIIFNPAVTNITLGSEIAITGTNGALNIVGTGANALTVTGGGSSRLFYTNNATVAITDMTLTGGNGAGQSGGLGNAGGAIFANGGSLTLNRVHVLNNTATIGNNYGGGVAVYQGANHRILNSTFSGNTAQSFGGGFYCLGVSSVYIANSTFSGNTSVTGFGGGLSLFGDNATVRNITVTGNTATSGGGLFTSGTVDIVNSIVAGNTGGSTPEIHNNGGSTVNASYCLVGDSQGDSGNTNQSVNYLTGNIRDTPPLLDALANYGGTTPTHRLQSGSPAKNSGSNSLAVDPFDNSALAFDQRGAGFARIVGSAVDIGAFEDQSIQSDQTITFNPNPLPTKTFGDPDFTVSASASSGLLVTFTASSQCTVSASTLSNNVSTATVHITGAGSCTITAKQAGNANYNPAADVVRTFTINKASQTITFNPNPLPAKTFGDADFTVTASASSNLTVTLTAGGNCTISGSTVHITGAGSCTITASQLGDANYNAATNVVRTFNINKANQTITFGAIANRTYGDSDFTVSATASSNLTVSFAASGNCTISGGTIHITGAGGCTITASQGGNANYNAAPSIPQSFSIAKAVLTVTAGDQSSQYSDAIPALTNYQITGFVNGENASVVSGAPALSTTATTQSAPGDYAITAAQGSLAAANYSFVFNSGNLHISAEDARAAVTGTFHKATSATGSNTAAVTLTATVIEAADGSLGSISTATVSFVNRDTGAILASNVPVTAGAQAGTGTASVTVTLSTDAADAEIFDIGTTVGGSYAGSDANDNALVTVAKPVSTNFISGGGNLVMQQSSGNYAGTFGSLMNFGLAVKHKASGAEPMGKFTVLIRSGGHVYQVKGSTYSAPMTLNLTNALARTAVLTGTGATITDITNPLAPIAVGSNATVRFAMTDRGEPGTTDSISVTVTDDNAQFTFSSRDFNGQPIEQATGAQTGAGNIIFRYISSPR